MKIALFATAALAAAAVAAPAFAQDAAAPSNYVQFNIGSGFTGQADLDATVTGAGTVGTDIDLDAGLFASVAGGHAFGNGFALEVEGVYAGNDGNEDDLTPIFGAGTEASVSTFGVLANARYEFNTGWNNVSPYVGAGIGYGAVNIDVDGDDDSQGGFMWQAKAGVVIHTNEQLAWDIGYRYLRAPQYDETTFVGGTTGNLTVDTGVHVLSAGARISF